MADQLTLSQPDGQIMPTTTLRAPPRFLDLLTALGRVVNVLLAHASGLVMFEIRSRGSGRDLSRDDWIKEFIKRK